jgi:hypothetical protein
MPISIVIAFNDIILEKGNLGHAFGFAIIIMNIFLMFSYTEYFVPLWTMKARIRGLDGLKDWRSEWRPAE